MIALVGMHCWYPGSPDPKSLWENVLGRRRMFRRFPDTRLPLADYWDPDLDAPDKTYVRRAALIDGFRFDWAGRRVPQGAFETTDMAHWLALEVAEGALADAGYLDRPFERTRAGVIVGNTLTGETSRANGLRQRWPYVRRALLATEAVQGLDEAERARLVDGFEASFLAPFPATNEDSLAGALSNTIAGRICGAFDLGGGGYTVDGACSSSLLAVCTAAAALERGDLDLALAGGVDISLDPFEIVGFAKTRALTRSEMRVYDARGDGFLPGEGCGFVVLRRLADAEADGDRILAVLEGWGVSSDGKGAITAPKASGQARAVKAAWTRAGALPDFVEGHGTGTAVGDRTELAGLALALPGLERRACGVTSLKSIVGHCKAAAGVGAFIKAAIAVNRRVIPPTAACEQPNPVFQGDAVGFYPVLDGRVDDPTARLRAGVSAMGFGGINAHVVVGSHGAPAPSLAPGLEERALLATAQREEVFPLTAASEAALRERLIALAEEAEACSLADLIDLAAHLAADVDPEAPWRSVLLASTPDALAEQARSTAPTRRPDAPRIGFLLPGQGSQRLGMARVLVERHAWARDLAARADAVAAEAGLPDLLAAMQPSADHTLDDAAEREAALADTALAQPAIVLASVLWARRLEALGLGPAVLAGHSLGELTALHLAGACDLDALIRVAVLRGRAMATAGGGAMLALACGTERARAVLARLEAYAAIANVNGPEQVVLSVAEDHLAALEAACAAEGVSCRRLPVTAGFHSDLVAEAAEALRDAPVPGSAALAQPVVSSVGGPLERVDDLPGHLVAHALGGVDFPALVAGCGADLYLEVGPGRVLSGLCGPLGVPCLPVEATPDRGESLQRALAAAFLAGAPVRWEALHADRLARPYVRPQDRIFLENPCERGAPVVGSSAPRAAASGLAEDLAALTERPLAEVREWLDRRRDFLGAVVKADLASAPVATPTKAPAALTLADLVARVTALTGFPASGVTEGSRLLDDLGLDSIKAGELVGWAARKAGATGRVAPASLANATLGEVVAALAAPATSAAAPEPVPTGPPPWVRSLGLALEEAALEGSPWTGSFAVLADPGDALGAALGGVDGSPPTVLVLPVAGDDPVRAAARLQGLARAAAEPTTRGVVIVQRTGDLGLSGGSLEAGGASAFARSLWLDRQDLAVRVVDLHPSLPLSEQARLVREALRGGPGVTVSAVGADGRRREPRARMIGEGRPLRPMVWGPSDVVVATGGGRGITAECALGLARATGVRTVLVGSRPASAEDEELVRTLGRFAAEGLEVRYLACDLADRDAVRAMVDRVVATWGPPTGILHGAGRNRPRRAHVPQLPEILDEVGPKLIGLMNLVDALPRPTRMIAALTSIIGVGGMDGNAWYAWSNEALDLWLGGLGVPAVSVAYGIWDEVGMGVKLGSVARLARQGVSALPVAEGVARFVDLWTRDPGVRQAVVAARFVANPAWPGRFPAVPALRFLDGHRTGVPGVELTVRLRLDHRRDPYVAEHVFHGSPLFPTVMGLEAMAQVASQLVEGPFTRILDVHLDRPIVVPAEGLEVQVRAVLAEDGSIACAIRPEGSDADHFSARLVAAPVDLGALALPDPDLALDPHEALYGGLLFQEGRFRRLGTVEHWAEREVRYAVEEQEGPWVLGDPFLRDALLQSGQLLIPHLDALPVRIEAIERVPAAPGPRRGRSRLLTEGERSFEGAVDLVDGDGRVVERVVGYHLQVLARRDDRPNHQDFVDPGPADERRVQALFPELTVVLAHLPGLNGQPVAVRHDRELPLFRTALARRGLEGAVVGWEGRRPVTDGAELSLSHDERFCLVVAADARVGCDLEPVQAREAQVWADLLGEHLGVQRALGGDPAVAGTRVWCALEALHKAGGSGALEIVSVAGSRVALRAGPWRIDTCLLPFTRGPDRIVAVARMDGAAAVAPNRFFDPATVRVGGVSHGGVEAMALRFVVPFSDASSITGRVTAAKMVGWMGQAREVALVSLGDGLREPFRSGTVGSVTTFVELDLEAPAEAVTCVEAVVWASGLTDRSATLHLELHAIAGGRRARRLATARQGFAWVEVLGHGVVRSTPFPEAVGRFLTEMALPRTDAVAPLQPVEGEPVATGRFETTFREGNLVGNLYFANYASWPEVVLDRFVNRRLPGYAAARGGLGELRVVRHQVDHRQEAMPFDTIDVALVLLGAEGSRVRFAVHTTRAGVLLALGRVEAEWLEDGVPAPVPRGLLGG